MAAGVACARSLAAAVLLQLRLCDCLWWCSFCLSHHQLCSLAVGAVQQAFAPEAEREELTATMKSECISLMAQHCKDTTPAKL